MSTFTDILGAKFSAGENNELLVLINELDTDNITANDNMIGTASGTLEMTLPGATTNLTFYAKLASKTGSAINTITGVAKGQSIILAPGNPTKLFEGAIKIVIPPGYGSAELTIEGLMKDQEYKQVFVFEGPGEE